MAAASIDVPGLGNLSAVADSPPGEQFWAGSFAYRDDGAEESGPFYLCVRGGHEPPPAQLDFARDVLSAIDRHIDAAHALLEQRLRDEPGFFGVDAAAGADYLAKGRAYLPFARPEPTFYGPRDWQLRFAESVLPKAETFGVSVTFRGTTPTGIEDLSESEPIE